MQQNIGWIAQASSWQHLNLRKLLLVFVLDVGDSADHETRHKPAIEASGDNPVTYLYVCGVWQKLQLK